VVKELVTGIYHVDLLSAGTRYCAALLDGLKRQLGSKSFEDTLHHAVTTPGHEWECIRRLFSHRSG
jgi:hypothetical protein